MTIFSNTAYEVDGGKVFPVVQLVNVKNANILSLHHNRAVLTDSAMGICLPITREMLDFALEGKHHPSMDQFPKKVSDFLNFLKDMDPKEFTKILVNK